MPFEVLDFALVFLGGVAGIEGTEVSSFAGVGVLLTGIEAVLAALEFSDHMEFDPWRKGFCFAGSGEPPCHRRRTCYGSTS